LGTRRRREPSAPGARNTQPVTIATCVPRRKSQVVTEEVRRRAENKRDHGPPVFDSTASPARFAPARCRRRRECSARAARTSPSGPWMNKRSRHGEASGRCEVRCAELLALVEGGPCRLELPGEDGNEQKEQNTGVTHEHEEAALDRFWAATDLRIAKKNRHEAGRTVTSAPSHPWKPRVVNAQSPSELDRDLGFRQRPTRGRARSVSRGTAFTPASTTSSPSPTAASGPCDSHGGNRCDGEGRTPWRRTARTIPPRVPANPPPDCNLEARA